VYHTNYHQDLFGPRYKDRLLDYLKDHIGVDIKPSYDRRDIQQLDHRTLHLLTTEGKIQSQIKPDERFLVISKTGTDHQYTYAFLNRIKEPFNLVSFDNHADNEPYDILNHMSFIPHAIRKYENLRKVIILGANCLLGRFAFDFSVLCQVEVYTPRPIYIRIPNAKVDFDKLKADNAIEDVNRGEHYTSFRWKTWNEFDLETLGDLPIKNHQSSLRYRPGGMT